MPASLQQGVEQELEGAVGLESILGAEADEDHSALPLFGHHHPRLLGNVLLADEPPALQEVAVGVADDGSDTTRCVVDGSIWKVGLPQKRTSPSSGIP